MRSPSRAAEMGRDVTNDMVAVISNPALSAAQKIQILTGVYGLPEVEAAKYVIP